MRNKRSYISSLIERLERGELTRAEAEVAAGRSGSDFADFGNKGQSEENK